MVNTTAPSDLVGRTAQAEALTLLKDWSIGLVTIQGIAIGFVGTMSKRGCVAGPVTTLCLLSFVLSIFSATMVLSVLPWLAMRTTIQEANQQIDKENIYEAPSIFKQVSVGLWCFLEHFFFAVGLVFFACLVAGR